MLSTETNETLARMVEIRDAIDRFNAATEEMHAIKLKEYRAESEVGNVAIVTFRLFNYNSKRVDTFHVEVKAWKKSQPMLLVRKAWKRLRRRLAIPANQKIVNVMEYGELMEWNSGANAVIVSRLVSDE